MTTNAQFATAFGIGRAPYAPGTVASFAAVVIAIPVIHFAGWLAILALALATTAAGVWFSEAYAAEVGAGDPQDCVIDEFAGQWFACAVAALGAFLNREPLGLTAYILAFAVFRLFDIAKPWPVSKAETLKGGYGIMADDVAAGLIAGIFVFLIEQSGFL